MNQKSDKQNNQRQSMRTAFELYVAIDVSKRTVKVAISLTDAYLPMVDRTSADPEFGADFRLYHTVHVAVQDGKL